MQLKLSTNTTYKNYQYLVLRQNVLNTISNAICSLSDSKILNEVAAENHDLLM
jgi:hypothetical protein